MDDNRGTNWIGGLILAVLLVGGCSDSTSKTVKIRGEVTVGGQPAAGARVRFTPADGATLPNVPEGEVGEDGTFNVSTYQPGDGLPEGRYKVTIVWKEQKRSLGETRDVGPDRLKGKYADMSKTPLEVTITHSTPDAKFNLPAP